MVGIARCRGASRETDRRSCEVGVKQGTAGEGKLEGRTEVCEEGGDEIVILGERNRERKREREWERERKRDRLW